MATSIDAEEQIPMLSPDPELPSHHKNRSASTSGIDQESVQYTFQRRQRRWSSLNALRRSIPLITLISSVLVLAMGALALARINGFFPVTKNVKSHHVFFMLPPANDTTAHTCHVNNNGHQECTAAYMEAGVGPHGYDFEAARALNAGYVPGPIIDKKVRQDRAFVTLLTHVIDVNDWYFTAVRLQAYRLRTRHTTKTPYPYIVLLPPDYPEWKTSRLIAEGVIVRHVDIITSPVAPEVHRWREGYTKLHIFNMTEYDRIVYLDADILILQSPEGLMANSITSSCNATFPTDKSTLDSHSNTKTDFELAYIKDFKTTSFNSGVMVVRPDARVFNDLLEELRVHNYDTNWADQALLNRYYLKAISEKDTQRLLELPRCYNTQWSSKADTEVSVDHPETAILLHRKPWDKDDYDDYFIKMFFRALGEMEGYWTAQLEASYPR